MLKWKPVELFVRGDSPIIDVSFKKDNEIEYARFDLGRRNFIDKPPIEINNEAFMLSILNVVDVNSFSDEEIVIPLVEDAPCRCGKINCDIVPEGYFEKLLEESKTWEKVEEDGDLEEPELLF